MTWCHIYAKSNCWHICFYTCKYTKLTKCLIRYFLVYCKAYIFSFLYPIPIWSFTKRHWIYKFSCKKFFVLLWWIEIMKLFPGKDSFLYVNDIIVAQVELTCSNSTSNKNIRTLFWTDNVFYYLNKRVEAFCFSFTLRTQKNSCYINNMFQPFTIFCIWSNRHLTYFVLFCLFVIQRIVSFSFHSQVHSQIRKKHDLNIFFLSNLSSFGLR